MLDTQLPAATNRVFAALRFMHSLDSAVRAESPVQGQQHRQGEQRGYRERNRCHALPQHDLLTQPSILQRRGCSPPLDHKGHKLAELG
jgi:hypothetical protein